jgi:hypothetical protein
MKLLGFVDLPIAAPTAIAAGTNLQWMGSGRCDPVINKNLGTLLDNQNERDTWYKGSEPRYPNYKRTASAGYVVITSRSENKVVFVDLQPLLAYYRTMYFTTQARYDSTKNVGQAANQWPFTFDQRPGQKPVVAYTLDVAAPTAVAAGLSGLTEPRWRESSFGDGYAYVTTMEGKLLMYTVGGLNTEAAATRPELCKIISIGKNPTSISHGSAGTYKNDIWINCRGDKSIYGFTADGDPIHLLRDSRIQDPVMTENSTVTNGQYIGLYDHNRLHVLDFAGKQVLTYVFDCKDVSKKDVSKAITFGAAADVPGYPFAYQQGEVQ